MPDITLSTDAKDFDEGTLPDFKSPIEISGEYSEPLDDD